MEANTPRSLALSAAMSATAALGDLLEFVREGEIAPCRDWETETIPQLADSLKMAIEAAEGSGNGPADAEGSELLNQLKGALSRFLEGWA